MEPGKPREPGRATGLAGPGATALYVCICNAITDRELRSAAMHCKGDVRDIYAALGKTPQCGQCLEEAAEIILEARDERRVPALVAS